MSDCHTQCSSREGKVLFECSAFGLASNVWPWPHWLWLGLIFFVSVSYYLASALPFAGLVTLCVPLWSNICLSWRPGLAICFDHRHFLQATDIPEFKTAVKHRFKIIYAETVIKVDKLTALAPLTIALVRVIVLSVLFPIAMYCTLKKRKPARKWTA